MLDCVRACVHVGMVTIIADEDCICNTRERKTAIAASTAG